ncbi:MAG: methyltransferase domain-containing protein [Pseudomonadota bacterium]
MRHFELSVFDGENGLDLQAIDRPDATYDMVVCNNVIEHVRDDAKALAELMRITRPGGVVALAFPDVLNEPRTRSWGYADPCRYGHFRVYGADVLSLFDEALPADVLIVVALGLDATTGVEEPLFFLTRATSISTAIKAAIPSAHLLKRDRSSDLLDYMNRRGHLLQAHG